MLALEDAILLHTSALGGTKPDVSRRNLPLRVCTGHGCCCTRCTAIHCMTAVLLMKRMRWLMPILNCTSAHAVSQNSRADLETAGLRAIKPGVVRPALPSVGCMGAGGLLPVYSRRGPACLVFFQLLVAYLMLGAGSSAEAHAAL